MVPTIAPLRGQSWKVGRDFRQFRLFQGLGLQGKSWNVEIAPRASASLTFSYGVHIFQLGLSYPVTQKAERSLAMPYGINRADATPSLTISTRVAAVAWSYREFPYKVWARQERGQTVSYPVLSYHEGF